MTAGDRKKQELQAEARSSPSGAVVYKAIMKEGFDELARPCPALSWSGLGAGLFMGASLIAEDYWPAIFRMLRGRRRFPNLATALVSW